MEENEALVSTATPPISSTHSESQEEPGRYDSARAAVPPQASREDTEKASVVNGNAEDSTGQERRASRATSVSSNAKIEAVEIAPAEHRTSRTVSGGIQRATSAFASTGSMKSENLEDEATDQVSELQIIDTRTGSRNRHSGFGSLERFSSLDASNLETLLAGGLDRFFRKFKNASKSHNLSFPTPEIHFENLSYTVQVSKDGPKSKGTITAAIRAAVAPCHKLRTVKKKILHPMSGVIKPGTMTLLLANPGAGKSTFLRALAGKLPTKKGAIRYSGLSADEIEISKLVGLVDQTDTHFPTLTVRETLQFADRCLNGDPNKKPEKLREVARLRSELFIHILGLTKCANTVVGDALLRGVSGGERKRVTIGEMLVGGQSVFVCDEISTGLDSAATFDIVKALRSWTRALGGSVVVALLQPPPEVVELFDDVLVLTEGRLVYHGPRVEMLPYFHSLGFACPDTTDPAEFVVDVVSGRGGSYLIRKTPNEPATPKPPRRAEQFDECFRNSHIHQGALSRIKETSKSKKGVQNENDLQCVAHLLQKNSHSKPFGTSFTESTLLLLERQKKIWLRDKPLVYGKLVEAVLVGLILGIIYFEADAALYLRMLFFAIAIFQRQAWQQITIGLHVRNIFYKQRSRNFFRTFSYTLAESFIQIPLNILVSLILVVIFYFMSGLARSADTFFVFYAIIVSFQHAIAAYFSFLASVSPSVTIAQALASLSVSFFLLFSGNIILPRLIPAYWRWMYWFNPVAWTLRSVLLNEFHDETKYTKAKRKDFLERFQVDQGPDFIWKGILVLICYYILFTLLNTAALHFIRYETRSTASSSAAATDESYVIHNNNSDEERTKHRRVSIKYSCVMDDQSQGTVETTPQDVSVDIPKDGTHTSTSFVRAYLAVKNLDYFVPNPSRPKEELQLLHGISAHFLPGTMTALMGSSGAGKTTFMDVLAGRKTGGRVGGEIIINGERKDPRTFSRIAGYCEQMDIHSEAATVREALTFSANLRLPAETTPEVRLQIINDTLELLELNGISEELVRSCSIEQKKRITIGVEVVSNPSILFLDEPTSGLDARSASIVMKGALSIARTGRTVLCTIHQPSIKIFEMFDSLLLLQRGGYMAYFGDLGTKSEHLLNYFNSIPGTTPMKAGYNPATYMLEVIGAGIGRGQAKDYTEEYKKSDLCAKNLQETNCVATGAFTPVEEGDKMVPFSTLKLNPMATPFKTQFRYCVRKLMLTYWRNPQYNLMRMVAFPIYAIIFGSTFYKLPQEKQAQVNSHIGLMYNSLDFIGVINLMTVLDITTSERAVYYRERMSNYYGALPYALSMPIAEFPYLVWVSFIFINALYWMVGWQDIARTFFLFWFVFYLHVSICTSFGQWMACLMPNVKVANVAVGALSVFFNLFSGFLMPHINMRPFYEWIRYLLPTNYSLESLVSIEMGQCDGLNDPSNGCKNVLIPASSTSAATYTSLKNFIWKNYGFQYTEVGANIGVLIAMYVCLQIAIYLTLRFISHLKR